MPLDDNEKTRVLVYRHTFVCMKGAAKFAALLDDKQTVRLDVQRQGNGDRVVYVDTSATRSEVLELVNRAERRDGEKAAA